MLSWGDDVEVHALHERGWTISAIARHTGSNRKTVGAYLTGQRQPGQRAKPAPSLIDPFLEYCWLRLGEDPHLWAHTLFDELVDVGFTGSYPTLTAAIRELRLRPHCEACSSTDDERALVHAVAAKVDGLILVAPRMSPQTTRRGKADLPGSTGQPDRTQHSLDSHPVLRRDDRTRRAPGRRWLRPAALPTHRQRVAEQRQPAQSIPRNHTQARRRSDHARPLRSRTRILRHRRSFGPRRSSTANRRQ